jgi:hypothetical protein
MADTQKRFEGWDTVECSECARYWDSSCDGVTGSKKPCNSYSATRSILIPEKLRALEKRVRWLTALVAALLGWCIGQMIGVLFFG